jgi:D-amino peptidase
MHAMAGTPDGVINHTVSGRAWQNLWFNDVLVGETGINAAFCGAWGCPVVLVTGDEATAREARALLGETLHTVTVKWGITTRAARNLTPKRARELIEAGAREALAQRERARPYDPGRPCEIRVEFTGTDGVEQYRNRAGVEVLDPRTIVSRADDWWTAWRQFFF